MKRILILSAGSKSLLVKYFQESGYYVVTTDCSSLTTTSYLADKSYVVPLISDPAYIDEILKITVSESVDAVLPLLEDELGVIAANIDRFREKGIFTVVSQMDDIEMCRDKWRFYQHMKSNGIPVLSTICGKNDILEACNKADMMFPAYMKPRFGSGSIGAYKVFGPDMAVAIANNSPEEMILQEYFAGDEYGVDAYIDFISGEVISVFIKKKLHMKAGETEKSVSVKDNRLVELIRKVVKTTGLRGPIDVDVFVKNDEYYVDEINPRFGGGYSHAYCSGISFPDYVRNNIDGMINKCEICEYEAGSIGLKAQDFMFINE